MKNSTTEIKNTLVGINRGLYEAENHISDLEVKVAENNPIRTAKRKRHLKSENSLRDLWDNIKGINICIIGVPEGEERARN